jgi:hypothetical protein
VVRAALAVVSSVWACSSSALAEPAFAQAREITFFFPMIGVVLDNHPDPAWAHGAITETERAEEGSVVVQASRELRASALPSSLRAQKGAHFSVFDDSGRVCDVTVERLVMTGDLRGGLPVDQPATLARGWRRAHHQILGLTSAACCRGQWARQATLPPTRAWAALGAEVDPAIAAMVRAAHAKLPGAEREVEAARCPGRPQVGDVGDEPTVAAVDLAGVHYLVTTQAPGAQGSCDQDSRAFWALWRVKSAGPVVLVGSGRGPRQQDVRVTALVQTRAPQPLLLAQLRWGRAIIRWEKGRYVLDEASHEVRDVRDCEALTGTDPR